MKNLIISIILILVLSLIFVACGGSEGTGDGGTGDSGNTNTGSTGGIYGHVTDFVTGEDVGNANVQLRPSGETTLTGSDGMFQFNYLPSGDYSLTVSKAGYSDLVDDYVITVRDRMVRRDIQIMNTNCEKGYWDGSKCDEFPPCDTKNITPCRDRDTNYIWSARARQDMDWDSAMAYCENLVEGEFSDWRLPSKDVLADLYNGNGRSKLGDTGKFWSSTSYDGENAYYVNFSDGSVISIGETDDDDSYKSYSYSVRCVRW